MPELTLYRVDARGRVNLDGIVDKGIEFYTAEKDDDGSIHLDPVKVATTAVKRTSVDFTVETEQHPTY